MRRFLQKLLSRPIIRLSDKYSSKPNHRRVFSSLTLLRKKIINPKSNRGIVIPFDSAEGRFIVLSDQHKGARDNSDDFALAEKNYLAALDYYDQERFTYINLGDSEELWENLFLTVKHHNKATFEAEKKFLDRDAFVKIFGNHDLYWDNDPLAPISLYQIYSKKFKVYEGIILQTTINKKPLDIYMTHGHQGDLQCDGNWFSKWFVSNVWAPVQSYLCINLNTPANNNDLKTAHNQMMYEWSSRQNNTLLITGHTHQPVFQSLTHIESLYIQRARAEKNNDVNEINKLNVEITKRHLENDSSLDFTGYRPTYFNSGCCCFDDGDITGIEIADGFVRLIKWEYDTQGNSGRIILEERDLASLINELETKV
ncbi:metallophosphoesterase [Mucilaginibacter agri]|uniref:Metallophosphoesterase n=1 Tax=Mucilaginibacter agri TaxID=2695265 RepID=A0A965ZGP4_9SPHI|nr:metallophosphoesterase [Mucilaginibacter agri]NCD69336.1 metallophosphoesterase [Mucilaginibacter agri]